MVNLLFIAAKSLGNGPVKWNWWVGLRLTLPTEPCGGAVPGFSEVCERMVLLQDATGAIAAKPQGNWGGTGKLSSVAGRINSRIKEKRDLTLDELVAELRDGHGGEVLRVAGWRFLRSLGLTHNKDFLAVKQKRPDVGLARPVWIGRRQSFIRNMLTRLAYIDIEAGKGIDPGD